MYEGFLFLKRLLSNVADLRLGMSESAENLNPLPVLGLGLCLIQPTGGARHLGRQNDLGFCSQ